jgi:hypothetical protein
VWVCLTCVTLIPGTPRYVEGCDGPAQALERHVSHFFERRDRRDRGRDPAREEDLPVLGLGTEPRGEIAHRADRGIARAVGKTDKIARGSAAERMRRSRQRRRAGLRCFRLELRNDEIEALVRLRLLSPGEQTNRNAVTKAMYAFLDRILGRPA